MLRNLNIGTKLFLSFSTIALIIIVQGWLGYRGNESMTDELFHVQRSSSVADAAMEIKISILTDQRIVMELINSRTPEELDNWWRDHQQTVKAFDLFGNAILSGAQTPDGTIYSSENPEVLALVKQADQLHNQEFSVKIKDIYETKKELFNLVKSGTDSEAVTDIRAKLDALDGEADRTGNQMFTVCNQVEELAKKVVKESITESQSAAHGANQSILTTIIIGFLIAMGMGYFLAKIITRPLLESLAVLKKISDGDLTVRIEVTQNDEIGQMQNALKMMTANLKQVLSSVISSSENVSTGSVQLSSSSQGVSQGATQQAASVEEVSSSIEEMRSTITQSSDNAHKTESIAVKSAQEAETSGKAVTQAVQAINEIAEKISIIEEISRQTNLLALNAAIEAARAGEHGKGFAVVASEVRKLAERSQQAANEISQLSRSTVISAEEAKNRLVDLVPQIKHTAELVQEISAASSEQESGIKQINLAIQNLDNVIQKNASASEEMAATSEELSSQALSLKDAISFFQIDQDNSNFSGVPLLPAD